MQPQVNSDIIRPKEAAIFLRCSEYTLRELVRKDKVPSFRVGNMIFLRKSSIIDWIEKQEKLSQGA